MKRWGEASWAAIPLRLVMGVIFVVSGYGKLMAMVGTVAYFAKHGFPIPVVTAGFIAVLEFFGGLALLLGLFVRYLGILYTIEFIVAAVWVKFPGVGYIPTRLDLMLIGAAVALVFLGAGPWSVDSAWLEKEKK